MMCNTLYYYQSENHCYSGDREDIIRNGNSKNLVITIIAIIINSTIINIISFYYYYYCYYYYYYYFIITIVVIMVIYSSRCYVLLDFWYLTPLLLYILIKLGSTLL